MGKTGTPVVTTRDRISRDAIVIATVAKVAADFGADLVPVTDERRSETNDPDLERIMKKAFEDDERTMLLVARARKAIAALAFESSKVERRADHLA